MREKTIDYIGKFIENCRNNCVFHDIVVSEEDGKETYFISKTFLEIKDDIIDEQFNLIKTAFLLDDNAKRLFHDAVCGSGNEWMEINQLKSSALLSFLCFHRVSSNCPITIGKEKYDRVMFEVKSRLEKKGRSHPVSSMDVVLLDDKSKSALFLESKFSEYITSKEKKVEVSSYYTEYYKEVFGDNLEFGGFKFIENEHKWVANKQSAYLEGVKQMISHYLGLRNSALKDNVSKWYDGLFKDKKIKLAEIVYRFGSEDNPADEFKNYKEISHQLFSRLMEDAGKHGIEVFPEILTYQDAFSKPENAKLLPDKVKAFYNIGKN